MAGSGSPGNGRRPSATSAVESRRPTTTGCYSLVYAPFIDPVKVRELEGADKRMFVIGGRGVFWTLRQRCEDCAGEQPEPEHARAVRRANDAVLERIEERRGGERQSAAKEIKSTGGPAGPSVVVGLRAMFPSENIHGDTDGSPCSRTRMAIGTAASSRAVSPRSRAVHERRLHRASDWGPFGALNRSAPTEAHAAVRPARAPVGRSIRSGPSGMTSRCRS